MLPIQRLVRSIALLTLAFHLLPTPARADQRPHAGMLRFPDVGRDSIVFVYANDIWLVPRAGGVATPLASPPGQELFPRFNADCSSIAFTGNYDGNLDLYVMPLTGGAATRVTHHPDAEMLCNWTPGGQLLFYSNCYGGMRRLMQLLTVTPTGGIPQKLPVPYGANGSISPDGEWLAYTPHTLDFRTWKRYRGGMATDIWLFNLKTKTSKKITDWEGTDTQPMWQGDTIYYLCDGGPDHRLNIWMYDTKSDKREQVTKFDDYDVKWPAIGPGDGAGEIVFQHGSDLMLLDLKSRQSKVVEVIVPGDKPKIRPRSVDVSKSIATLAVSPTGKRALVEARGDVWSLPAQKGSPRALTSTSTAAERDPTWSPDGKWIAYFSDATGEYELCAIGADGKGKPVQLTTDAGSYKYDPTWSPDSKKIAFTDKAGNIFLLKLNSPKDDESLAAQSFKKIDTDPWANQPSLRWSHDSNWIAYTKAGDNLQNAIWLYDLATDKPHQVTSGMFNDTQPTFDRKGDFLYFASARAFNNPIYEDLGNSFVYTGLDVMLMVPLRKDVKNPLAPKSDEETPTTQPADATSQPASAPASQPTSKPSDKPLIIDLEGFESRAVALPIKKGGFFNVCVGDDGKLIYVRGQLRGSEGEPSIVIFDVNDDKSDKKEEKTVIADTGAFVMSADGKKLLVQKKEALAIVDAAADQKMDKPVPTDGMLTLIEPRAEWKQMFTEAWRIERDFFYVANMHGVDWPAIRKQYERMLEECICREDVGFVISEMISELNIGHAYYSGGDNEKSANVPVGMLGADFELADGAFRIKKILHGAPWEHDGRGPLSQPGVDVKEGDYLLAVNNRPLDAAKDPWAALQGLAGKTVRLTVSAKPTMDKDARDVVVDLMDAEAPLRYRDWVEHNRAYVEKQTGGDVGYIHVPNTGVDGQNELFRQFYGQVNKKALIIDERWNGGGQIPTRFIELLNRPATNCWARRDGNDWVWPPDSHQGPKCMLVNGLAGSGGDAFPHYFKMFKLGKVIGTRTWGGLVGISGNPDLIDGASVTAPTFGHYDMDGTWGVEGHGVDPDIVVVDDPALMTNGGDPQLDTAIKLMLDEVASRPFVKPKRPAPPDRRGMGIKEEDK
jgi:tricorn protease